MIGIRDCAVVWLWGGWRASHEAVNQLMDREWPEDERQQFLDAAAQTPSRASQGLHDLRTRKSGTLRFVQFHVWVPADWTVQEAHDRLDRRRGGASGTLSSGTEILIHVDPGRAGPTAETLLSQEITEQASVTSIPILPGRRLRRHDRSPAILRRSCRSSAGLRPMRLMQAIAAENNLSETAFTVLERGTDD